MYTNEGSVIADFDAPSWTTSTRSANATAIALLLVPKSMPQPSGSEGGFTTELYLWPTHPELLHDASPPTTPPDSVQANLGEPRAQDGTIPFATLDRESVERCRGRRDARLICTGYPPAVRLPVRF